MQAKFEKIAPPAGQSFKLLTLDLPGFPFFWHFHPEYELTLILASSGRRLVGDAFALFQPGELVLLGPDLPHCWESVYPGSGPRRAQAVVVQFGATCLGAEFFQRLPETSAIRALLEKSRRGLLFDSATAERLTPEVVRLAARSGLPALTGFLDILHELAEAGAYRELASPGFRPHLDTTAQGAMDAVCRWVARNLENELPHAEAARRAHLSGPAFSRFFRRQMGKTFTRYVQEVRVGEACRLLMDTDLTVAEICYRAGFGNLANFNRRFKEQKGVPPSAFRRQYRRST